MKSVGKVLCIGDIILDRYSEGRVDRISPEAPIPVLKLSKENKEVLGGSGNVARNICASETKCHLISVIGNDGDSKKIISLCKRKNLSFDLIIDKSRCTTKKHTDLYQEINKFFELIMKILVILTEESRKRY